MEIKIYLILLLMFCSFNYSKCVIKVETDDEEEECIFTLSDGDYDEFLSAVPQLRNCTEHYPNLEVKLNNYFLPAFPNGTFSDLYLDTFSLNIVNSKVQLLSPLLPNYHVFEHMKFHSAIINVTNSASLSGWKMEALTFFDEAEIEDFTFIAVKSKLVYLPTSFGKIAGGKLIDIKILKCSLRWLGSNVFAPFTHLRNLELRDNLIAEIERSHLPATAHQLQSIDLGNNRLQYLPSDLFRDSKLGLQRIHLDGNNIKILEDQMRIILESRPSLFLHGVLWFCSCNEILKLHERFSDRTEHSRCFKDDFNIIKVKDFVEECRRKLEA